MFQKNSYPPYIVPTLRADGQYPGHPTNSTLMERLDKIETTLNNTYERLVRTETRLVLLMRADGLDANGNYID